MCMCMFKNELSSWQGRSAVSCLPVVDETLEYSGDTVRRRRTQAVAAYGCTGQLGEVANVDT